MQSYIEPIMNAVWLFPFVAGVFTIPYLAVQYHRRGSIPLLRTIIVYSFILYLMCAYFLTMLPLPKYEDVAQMTSPYLQLTPFADPVAWVRESGAVLAQPATWVKLINRDLFVMVANIVMTIPFGIYLRYYFHCSLKKTLFLSLGLSLIFELTQLSALFGIYPRPYRLCETDDLITNTLGGVIGWWLAKPLTRILPSTERLDEVAYRRSAHVSVMRRLAAALFDWMLLGFAMLFVPLFSRPFLHYVAQGLGSLLIGCGLIYIVGVFLYFMLGEWLFRGYTPGKRLMRTRMVDERTHGRPKLWQCIVRYALVYYLFVPLPFAALFALMLTTDDQAQSMLFVALFAVLAVLYALMVVFVVIRVVSRSSQLPHGQLSKTTTISTLVVPDSALAHESDCLPAASAKADAAPDKLLHE